MLITLSGIDGSGKSSHSAAIVSALRTRGIEPRQVTARIGRLTPLRRLVAANRRRRTGSEFAASSPRATADTHWTGWRLTAWAIITALDYGLWLQWVRWLRWRGQTVIADRYLCDFAVEFSILVRSQPALAQALLALLRLVEPQPARAYFLRIDPALSMARKPEDQHGYNHDEVCRAYDALAGRYGLRVVGNDAPFEQVSGVIVPDVLEAFSSV